MNNTATNCAVPNLYRVKAATFRVTHGFDSCLPREAYPRLARLCASIKPRLRPVVYPNGNSQPELFQ